MRPRPAAPFINDGVSSLLREAGVGPSRIRPVLSVAIFSRGSNSVQVSETFSDTKVPNANFVSELSFILLEPLCVFIF